MSNGRSVAVVAVTRAPADSLPAFLDSLAQATVERVEVVLAHQGEPGEAARAAAERGAVRLVDASDRGYGQAVNLGVYATTEEFVVVASPEIVWDPGSLDALLDATRRWPSGAAFGPLIRTPAGIYPSARSVPSLRSGIGHALFGWWLPNNPWTRAYRHERDTPAERTAGWLVGTCLLIRRDAFDGVGGFNADRLVYLEDLDLGERLVKAGWHNIYVPSAVVHGEVRQAAEPDSAKVAADQHRSVWGYLSRRYAGWRWLPVRVALRVGLAVRAALAKRIRRMVSGTRGAPRP